MSEYLIDTAKPCCVFLGLASIASGRPLEDAEEDERIAEEEEDAAAAAVEHAKTSSASSFKGRSEHAPAVPLQ